MADRNLRDWPETRFIDDMTYLYESEQKFGSCTYNCEILELDGKEVVVLYQQRITDEFVPIPDHPQGGGFKREQGITIPGYAVKSWFKRKIELIPEGEREKVADAIREDPIEVGRRQPDFIEFWN